MKTKKSVIALLTVFLFQDEKQMVKKLSSSKDRSILLYVKEMLQHKLALLEADQIEQLYEKLMPLRHSTALMVYAAKLSSLNEPKVMRDLGRYVNGVITETFLKERYEPAHNPHLQEIAKNHAPILQQWQVPLKLSHATFQPEATTSLLNAVAWLRDKLDNKHMGTNPLPHSQSLLNQIPVDEALLLPIELAMKEFLSASTKEEQIDSLKRIHQELQNLAPCEFRNDVTKQLEAFTAQGPGLPQEVDLVDTDHYFDLLMSGTEVAQSCQRVDGTPSLNRGLLGYLLDGKNRLLVVKDKQGKIMSRAKLSLLWDGTQPVLFLERLYTQGTYEKQCRQAIVSMAHRKAQDLGLELVVATDSEYPLGENFPRDLHALGSGVSYEYSDAMHSVQKDGMYTISKASLALLSTH